MRRQMRRPRMRHHRVHHCMQRDMPGPSLRHQRTHRHPRMHPMRCPHRRQHQPRRTHPQQRRRRQATSPQIRWPQLGQRPGHPITLMRHHLVYGHPAPQRRRNHASGTRPHYQLGVARPEPQPLLYREQRANHPRRTQHATRAKHQTHPWTTRARSHSISSHNHLRRPTPRRQARTIRGAALARACCPVRTGAYYDIPVKAR